MNNKHQDKGQDTPPVTPNQGTKEEGSDAKELASEIVGGFAESMKESDDGVYVYSKSTGLWRPTQAGIEFAHGRTKVSSIIYVFHNTIYGEEKPLVDIYECLGKNRSYDALMSRSWGEAVV